MVFVKGQSGNPGGRPKTDHDMQERCRALMSKTGWNKFVSLMESDDPEMLRFVLKLTMEYGYGKPPASMQITGKNGGPFSVIVQSVADRG